LINLQLLIQLSFYGYFIDFATNKNIKFHLKIKTVLIEDFVIDLDEKSIPIWKIKSKKYVGVYSEDF